MSLWKATKFNMLCGYLGFPISLEARVTWCFLSWEPYKRRREAHIPHSACPAACEASSSQSFGLQHLVPSRKISSLFEYFAFSSQIIFVLLNQPCVCGLRESVYTIFQQFQSPLLHCSHLLAILCVHKYIMYYFSNFEDLMCLTNMGKGFDQSLQVPRIDAKCALRLKGRRL